MAELDYRAFDADNHYYEAEDAFIRHIEPTFRKRAMQWAEVDGRKRLIVGGRINRFIPNPTFDPVARPGSLDDFFRGKNTTGGDMASHFGQLEPIDPAFRDHDARLALMDSQNLEAAFLFPTLGVGMEEPLLHDPPACAAAFRAFNRWLDEDWGFAYRESLFAAPYITLLEPEAAAAELEWALGRDARVVCMRAGPIHLPGGSRSPVDPLFDRFWSLANESGITVAYHAGDSGYGRYAVDWGEPAETLAFLQSPLKQLLSASPIHDTLAALVGGRVFERFPNLRVATIESGSSWVQPLFRQLKKAFGQMPRAFPENPIDTFKRHVWVSPYYEDDLVALKDALSAQHILFGSDFPHAEGLADPVSFVHDLKGYDEDETRLVMRENALALSRRRPA